METDQTKAGHRLGAFIESLGISKKEFTRKTGLDYAHLHKITNGINDPGFETCSKISEAYPELSLTWLITGVGEMKTSQERKGMTYSESECGEMKTLQTRVQYFIYSMQNTQITKFLSLS